MTFWQIVAAVKARLRIVIGLVVVTVLSVLVAAPRPKVTYETFCYMSPTPQAMRGGISTASETPQSAQPSPDRNVILSNLVLLAASGQVRQRALDFLALPADEQKEAAPGPNESKPEFKQITRVMYNKNEPLETKDWNDILLCTPVINASVAQETTTSDIIRIRVKMPMGDDAVYLANAVGVAFAEVYGAKSHDEMQKYIKFLESGTQESHEKLLDIESRMAEYQRIHKVTGAESETQNAVMALSSLEAQRNVAQSESDAARSALMDSYRQLAEQPLVRTESLPAALNPKVAKLKEELDQAEAELRQLALKYKPGHLTYQAQEKHIQSLRNQIAKEGSIYKKPAINDLHGELVKQRSQLSGSYASASAKLAALNAQVAAAQTKIANMAGTQKGIVDLSRDHRRASEDYALFSGRLSQARIADKEFEKYGSILPFDWASTAGEAIVDGPRKRTLLIYGFILSLIFGIGLCVWLESIDNKVRDVKDVEKLLGLPSVGVIPAIEGRELPTLTHLFPLSAAAESYRMLRTNILFAQRDKPFKTLMSATSKPGQGATTTICNLAIALAQAGQKITLIDADLRRPALHKFFNLPNDKGLSTLLGGKDSPLDCMLKTAVPNLIIIPAGPPPLNPSELLASTRMFEIVEWLKEHSDMVLFDTPSTVVFSDGAVLASWLDAVMFVMSADQVPRGTEQDALNLLRRAKANIIGVVVNRMSPDNVDNCHFYSHYYSTPNMDADIYSLMADKKAIEGETASVTDVGKIGPSPADDPAVPPTGAEVEKDDTKDDNPFPV